MPALNESETTIRLRSGGGLKVCSWREDLKDLLDPDEVVWLGDRLCWSVRDYTAGGLIIFRGRSLPHPLPDGQAFTRAQICQLICEQLEKAERADKGTLVGLEMDEKANMMLNVYMK